MNTEDLERLVSGWGGGDWTDEVIAAGRTFSGRLHVRSLRLIADRAEQHLEKGQLGRAYNWSFLGIVLTKGSLVAHPDFSAVYQPSGRSKQRRCAALKVLRRLEQGVHAATLGDAAARLTSWRTFLELAISIEPQREDLLRRIIGDPHALYLAAITLEEAFAEPPAENREQLAKNRLADLSREELGDAVSFIFATLAEAGRLNSLSFPRFREDEEVSAEREQILVDSYRLRELHATTQAIFRLGYRCHRRSDGTFVLDPPDETFGMALTFGYMKTQQMSSGQLGQGDESDAVTFREMCQEAVRRFGKDFTRIADRPRRLVLEFPEPLIKVMGDRFLLTRELFREDIWHLRDACYEMGVSMEDIESFEIAPGLTLMDALVLARVFRFLHFFRQPALRELRETDHVAYLNSVLMAATEADHVRLLSMCGLDPRKAEGFIKLLSWSPESGALDLQYRPIVNLGLASILFASVLTSSNTLRNVLFASGRRLNDDGIVDPVSGTLADAFRTRTTTVWSPVPYRWQEQGDVDVLVLLDGALLAFECKNTLLPCSAFEQRTLYDYLMKAASQLDRFKAAYGDEEFRTVLSRRFDVALPPPSSLVTAIVLSNRLLSGAQFRGHPVRHVHELANLVTAGAGRLQSTLFAKPLTISLWRGSGFSIDAVTDYLSERAVHYAPVWAAMDRAEEVLDTGAVRVRRAKYGLNVGRFLHELSAQGFIDLKELDEPVV